MYIDFKRKQREKLVSVIIKKPPQSECDMTDGYILIDSCH